MVKATLVPVMALTTLVKAHECEEVEDRHDVHEHEAEPEREVAADGRVEWGTSRGERPIHPMCRF